MLEIGAREKGILGQIVSPTMIHHDSGKFCIECTCPGIVGKIDRERVAVQRKRQVPRAARTHSLDYGKERSRALRRNLLKQRGNAGETIFIRNHALELVKSPPAIDPVPVPDAIQRVEEIAVMTG